MKINKIYNRVGIKSILLMSFVAGTVLLTLILTHLIGVISTRQVKESIGQSLSELAFQTTDKLDRGMYERYREVQLMAARPELGDSRVPAVEKRRLLERMQDTYPYYAWLGLTDNEGNVLVAGKGLLEGANVSTRAWYTNAHRGIHLTDVHDAVLLAKLLPNPSGEPKRFFDVAFPYFDKLGDPAGIFGVHLSWTWASEIEKSVFLPLATRSKVETFIVSADSVVLLGPPPLLGKDLSLAALRKAASEQNGFVVERWDDGREYLVGFSRSTGYSSYPGLGWVVLVRQSLDEAYAPIYQLQRQIIAGGLLVAIIFSVLALVLARRLSRPLRLIAESAHNVENGMGDAIAVAPNSYKEVHSLTNALNSLVGKLKHNEANLRELNGTLERRVKERTAEVERALFELKSKEQRIRAIVDTAHDAFISIDEHGHITDCNKQAEEMFGWRREEVLGKVVESIIMPPQYRDVHQTAMRRFLVTGGSRVVGKRVELTALRRTGEEFPVEIAVGYVRAGEQHFFSAFINDISDRKYAEQALKALATQDPLTGLPNRRACMIRLEEAMNRVVRNGKPAAVMFLDIDKFKLVNDTYGHEVGDTLLIGFSKCLRAATRTTDFVARLAGDEFVIVAEGLSAGVEDAAVLARKVITAMTELRVTHETTCIAPTTSIGIVLYQGEKSTPAGLLKAADEAMYAAKQAGRNSFQIAVPTAKSI